MKILITGCAGFMGSHLADYLKGHEVYGIDNESIGLHENVPAHVIYTRLDMRDAEALRVYIEHVKPELIYHLAAFAHEGLSQFCPKLITENNYEAFLNLIVPAINNGLRKIVVCSSMSVYGAQTPPFHEDLPTMPEDVYAVSKAAMETSVKILSEVHGFEYVIVRPHNVYGPRQALHDPYRNVVGIFMNRIMKGLPPIIYGDGEQTRAFSYIDDVTPYLAKTGLLPINKEIINLGPLEEYTINHLATVVLQAFNSTLTPIHHRDRPKEVKHAYCTNAKAQELLGYKTSTTLEEGVSKMAEWAKKIGSKDFHYFTDLEIPAHAPETWKNHLL